jgi:hypothetical protein
MVVIRKGAPLSYVMTVTLARKRNLLVVRTPPTHAPPLPPLTPRCQTLTHSHRDTRADLGVRHRRPPPRHPTSDMVPDTAARPRTATPSRRPRCQTPPRRPAPDMVSDTNSLAPRHPRRPWCQTPPPHCYVPRADLGVRHRPPPPLHYGVRHRPPHHYVPHPTRCQTPPPHAPLRPAPNTSVQTPPHAPPRHPRADLVVRPPPTHAPRHTRRPRCQTLPTSHAITSHADMVSDTLWVVGGWRKTRVSGAGDRGRTTRLTMSRPPFRENRAPPSWRLPCLWRLPCGGAYMPVIRPFF